MVLNRVVFFPKHFCNLTLRQCRIVPNNFQNPLAKRILHGFSPVTRHRVNSDMNSNHPRIQPDKTLTVKRSKCIIRLRNC